MVICIAIQLQGELNISSENCILKFFYPYNLFFLLQGVRLFILIELFISPTHDLATMLLFIAMIMCALLMTSLMVLLYKLAVRAYTNI